MSLTGKYLSTLPATKVVDGEEIEYPHMIPLWWYLMTAGKCDFRSAVLAIRKGEVTMRIDPSRPASAASEKLKREEAKEGRTKWQGNMTNPDTLLFCRVTDDGQLDSLDLIQCWMIRAPSLRAFNRGLLTKEQFASLPDLYQSVLDPDELPVLVFSDAAAEWFDAP